MFNRGSAQSPIYGALAPRAIPKQNQERVILLVDKFMRSHRAMDTWAKDAKRCVDFMEGRQWTKAQIAKLEAEGRPALVFNKINPLVRLVLGYHRNNRIDVRFLPGHDGTGTEDVADILTHLFKSIGERNQLPFVDAECFMDGLVTGRGFMDMRLDFSENDFGEVKITAKDPFSIYLDDEADGYDLNTGNSIREVKWASIDEVEWAYGKEVADLVRPFTSGNRWAGFPTLLQNTSGETTPIRTFGQEDDNTEAPFYGFRDLFHQELVDDTRKNIRVIDTQYYVTEMKPCFIDLETGDRSPVPDHWGKQQIGKALYHAERVGNPLAIERRPVRRVRWSVLVGDVLVHDGWSPYDTFTTVGFFPYFRRGVTGGMVRDLIDPQMEANKRRMAQIEMVGRTANGGWMYEEGSLDPIQEGNLKKHGSTPGVVVKYKNGKQAPQQIDPAPPPTSMERLEMNAEDDLRTISGINESALGQLDTVQSGRAIEARQRQAVIALQMYMDNFARTKELQGRKVANLCQRHYTEERIFRSLGEDGKQVTKIINQRMIDPTTGDTMDKLNDITVGKYSVAVDETPMSASFQNAQFEEMLSMVEKMGMQQVGPVFLDLLVDLSSIPQKDKIKERLVQMGIVPPDDYGGEPGMPGAAPPVEEQQQGALPAPVDTTAPAEEGVSLVEGNGGG